MSEKPNSYDIYVIQSVLENNEFGIQEVKNLRNLNARFFIQEEYPVIEKLILSKDIEGLKTLPANQRDWDEYLNIMIFNDQNDDEYIVTVYDSIELTQNPKVISIYSMQNKS